MKFIQNTIIISIFLTIIISCSSSKTATKTEKSPTIVTIDKEEIPVSEFNYVYKKNNSKTGDAYSEKSLNEYMNLYLNFRLKVKEAEELGYDTTKEFLKEYNQYKEQLAQPYLTEKSVTEKILKEAYDRMLIEVSAAHILIRFPEEPSPADTLRALTKIKAIKKQLDEGMDFETLASKSSEDPSAAKNSGNLGYFTAMQMVYPFENAAYSTLVGQVSDIVRTKFGYHILKVKDKREARGEVEISHIMLRATEGMNPGDLITAEKKINEIHSKLTAGEDWSKLCSQFSEDSRTAESDGNLPWISTGKVSPEFEDAAFSLITTGEISKPVRSPYGWHIIRLNNKKAIEPFAKVKSQLKTQIEKDVRADLPKEAFISRIKKENNFIENAKSKKYAFSLVDSTLANGNWKYNKEDKKLSLVLFTIQNNNFTIEDFFNFMLKRQRNKEGSNHLVIADNLYKSFSDEKLIDNEKSILEEKYEDYRLTLKEYKYGILLFKLMDERVWTKAIKDTTGLKEYFEANKNKYQWNDRYVMTILNAQNPGILVTAVKDLNSKKYESLNLMEKEYNKDYALRLEAESGTYELNDKPFLKTISGKIGEERTVFNDRYFYFNITEKIPAGPKKYEETRGLLISDYQSKLEADWLNSLKAKYKYSINQEEFDKLVH